MSGSTQSSQVRVRVKTSKRQTQVRVPTGTRRVCVTTETRWRRSESQHPEVDVIDMVVVHSVMNTAASRGRQQHVTHCPCLFRHYFISFSVLSCCVFDWSDSLKYFCRKLFGPRGGFFFLCLLFIHNLALHFPECSAFCSGLLPVSDNPHRSVLSVAYDLPACRVCRHQTASPSCLLVFLHVCVS